MGDAIKHGLANLLNIQEKDDRPTFWWWVLFVVLVSFGISTLASFGFIASSVGDAMSLAADGVDEAQVEAVMMKSMAGGLKTQTWIGTGVTFVGLVLVIAAFARRLRDAGLPVILAILPVISTIVSSYFNLQLVDEMSAVMATGDLAAMEELTASSASTGLLGWLGYLVVIVGGLWPSKNA